VARPAGFAGPLRLPVLLAVLVAATVLAGCAKPKDETPAVSTPAAFDPADPRLPHGPDGALALPAGATPAAPGFPLFSPPAAMNQSYAAHRETSLALGSDGLRFACDPSGVPNTRDGHSFYYLSRDNGTTWSDVQAEQPAQQLDPRALAFEGGDCDVAVGPAGELWTADSWLGSLSVGLSRDGGETWRGTPVAASSPVVDRPWLAVDGGGVLHLTYQDVQALMPSAIWYTHAAATEGALAFAPAVPVADADPNGGFTWTGNLVVSPDGQDLWSVYTRRAGPVTNDLEGSGPETVWVARSTDGGLAWSSVKVSDRPHPASFLYPSIARDGLGTLHVVFAQGTGTAHPVFHSFSTDGGLTWSEPRAVRDGVSGYSPWVAGGPGGGAAIQWYGSPDPTADLGDNETAWYTYWALATPEAGGYAYTSGTTTAAPMFVGEQGEAPEFNMVRLDADGRMHLGLSVPVYSKRCDCSPWWALYQAQVTPPTLPAAPPRP
jgi:hypothetical protein